MEALTRENYEEIAEAFAGAKGSGWLRANCPICPAATGKEDRKRSLGLNRATGGLNCPKCGLHGRLPPDLRDELGIELASFSNGRQVEVKPNVGAPQGFLELFAPGAGQSVMYDAARAYLTWPSDEKINGYSCRGLNPAHCAAARVGIASGFWGGRIICPIPDMEAPSGPWVGWFARDYMGRQDGKHLYSKGMDRNRAFFNYSALLEATDIPLIVVEGCLDAVAVWPHGFPVLGKPLESHFRVLAACKRPVAVVMDGDAVDEGWALSTRLRMLGQRAGCVKLGPKMDPDEIPLPELMDACKRSIDTVGRVAV